MKEKEELKRSRINEIDDEFSINTRYLLLTTTATTTITISITNRFRTTSVPNRLQIIHLFNRVGISKKYFDVSKDKAQKNS